MRRSQFLAEGSAYWYRQQIYNLPRSWALAGSWPAPSAIVTQLNDKLLRENPLPLNADGERLIRANLEQARQGGKPRPATVGRLTDKQLAKLNEERAKRKRDPMDADVVFVGLHIYERRIVFDGFSVDDVVLQIVGAMDGDSIIRMSQKMTALQSCRKREDGYGNQVTDEAVLECTGKDPTA